MAEVEPRLKRPREDDGNDDDDGAGHGFAQRRAKKNCNESEDSTGNQRHHHQQEQKELNNGRGDDHKQARVGPRCFKSSVAMLDYFYELLHGWPLNFNFNKYEHLMLEDLIKLGHSEAQNKIGPGIKAFQIRLHPEFENRCYYIIRKDGSAEDFSYRKCVDTISPLPESVKSKVAPSKHQIRKSKSKHQRGKGNHGRKGSRCPCRGRGI